MRQMRLRGKDPQGVVSETGVKEQGARGGTSPEAEPLGTV